MQQVSTETIILPSEYFGLFQKKSSILHLDQLDPGRAPVTQTSCLCDQRGARTFGIAGGPGCPTTCPSGRSFKAVVYDAVDGNDAGLKPPHAVANKATSLLPSYGAITVTPKSGTT